MTTLHISCPHCGATNRVPEERLADNGKCGRCKTAFFNGKPQIASADNFQKIIHNNDIPVLIDCWASWCGPCQQFAPTFDQAAQQFEPYLRCVKLDTENEQQIAAQLAIRSIPTLILYRQGKEIDRISGALPLAQLKQWLASKGVND